MIGVCLSVEATCEKALARKTADGRGVIRFPFTYGPRYGGIGQKEQCEIDEDHAEIKCHKAFGHAFKEKVTQEGRK